MKIIPTIVKHPVYKIIV